jgi:DNA polymerase-3 subunit delta
MKLSAERLRAQLDKGLAPLYVLAGDEPLLVDEALALIRERAERDCGERESRIAERSFDWTEFAAGLRNLSLFSSRRLVELRLPTGKPGDAGARFLAELAAAPDTGNVIVLLLPALDSQTARSKWASSLAEAGTWVELRPPSREELPAWLARRLKAARLTADEEALDLLASRVEGNLLAAKQEIDKLALLVEDGRVTAGAIRDSVADDARFDVFQLSEAALAGDPERTVRVLQGLKREGESEVLVLWSLARDVLTLADVATRAAEGRSIDQALEAAGVWRSRQNAFRAAAQGRGLKAIGRLVRSTARADQIVKGIRRGDPWNALLEVSLGLSGGRPTLAETG